MYIVESGDPRLTAPFDPRRDNLLLRADAPCPCGSRSILANCCGRGGGLRPPAAAALRAKLPPIRYRNPACYAASDWGCVRKLSAEHPISAAVLRVLSADGHRVTVTGHPWQGEPIQAVAIEELQAKVLCRRHNEMLGPLDSRMATLFAWVRRATAPLITESPPASASIRLANGHDVERWMLKTLCATLKAHPTPEGIGGSLWTIPHEWLSVLLGRARWPDGCGLYLDMDPGVRWGSILVRPITARVPGERLPVGVKVWIHGLVLRLFMVNPRGITMVGSAPTWLHRPGEIRWCRGDHFASVVFGWTQRGRNSTTRLNVRLDVQAA